MSWRAPAVGHLLDNRLQTARLELLDDARIQQALHRQGQETTAFLRTLLEEKLAAAARSGVGAVEASLRTEATDFLVGAGLELQQVRSALDALGDALLDTEGLHPHELQADPPRPTVLASLFFVGWLVTITLGWLMGDAHGGLFTLFIGGGAFVAGLVYFMAHVNNLRHRVEVVQEYPVHLCCHYITDLEEGIARYEAAVNTLTRSDSDGAQ